MESIEIRERRVNEDRGADLVGLTRSAERSRTDEVANVLDAYRGVAAPVVTRDHGGELEKLIGDAPIAGFDGRGNPPDHARRAACAALAPQHRIAELADRHAQWPRMCFDVNSGEVVLREIGGPGHVAYPIVGGTVDTCARLESLVPPGRVSIGADTHVRLPARLGLRLERRTRSSTRSSRPPSWGRG